MLQKRIMVVEDEAVIAEGIKANLESQGYVVSRILNTGEKALAEAGKFKPDL